MVEPSVIIPLPVSKFKDTGRGGGGGGDISRPWILDGKKWHIEKRCSIHTRPLFLSLHQLIKDNLDVEHSWNQKGYVAYRVGGPTWLFLHTRPNMLRLDMVVKRGLFNQGGLAEKLGLKEFSKEESLSEKLNLDSSILIYERNEKTDKIIMRIKEGFDLENPALLEFFKKTYDRFSR